MTKKLCVGNPRHFYVLGGIVTPNSYT